MVRPNFNIFNLLKKIDKNIFCAAFIIISSTAFSQENPMPGLANKIETDSIIIAWLSDLYEHGVKIENDSLIFNAEAQRLLTDEEYHQFIYPETYSWDKALSSIQKLELKQAFWFLINLYLKNDENKNLVIKSLLSYDRFLKMDKVLVSTFYTYILMDPEIGTIENGQSKIIAPHIMENKLNALKEILFYLDKYKEEDRKD
jgi:hypothetical protein